MSGGSMKAGMIGAGFAARFHAAMLRRVHAASVELHAVYAPTREHREAYAQEQETTAVATVEALIDSCDVIHICSPPSSHQELATQALAAGKHVIVEKPFTGYFGDGSDGFSGITFNREQGLQAAMDSVRAIRAAEAASDGTVAYAENWVYAPAVQKEREVIEKTDAQLLWLIGEESHSGSHSPYYGMWESSGGGSIMGKGVHPLTAVLYLKVVEGRARGRAPIRPRTVSARTHRLTALPGYRDAGHLRTDYKDIEDWGSVHVEFTDGTIADVYACEVVMGGVHNWLEVNANNHRARININPNNALSTYNPTASQFDDIYVVEKIGTKEGWASTSPDEDWFTGYQHEMDAFYGDFANRRRPESDSLLGADTIATVYAAYLSAARSGAAVEVPLV